MTKLPHDFDLFFDIKTVEELHRILIEDSLESYNSMSDLFELIDQYNITLPNEYIRRFEVGFPVAVWIRNDGTYRIDPPSQEEKGEYQRMRRS